MRQASLTRSLLRDDGVRTPAGPPRVGSGERMTADGVAAVPFQDGRVTRAPYELPLVAVIVLDHHTNINNPPMQRTQCPLLYPPAAACSEPTSPLSGRRRGNGELALLAPDSTGRMSRISGRQHAFGWPGHAGLLPTPRLEKTDCDRDHDH